MSGNYPDDMNWDAFDRASGAYDEPEEWEMIKESESLCGCSVEVWRATDVSGYEDQVLEFPCKEHDWNEKRI